MKTNKAIFSDNLKRYLNKNGMTQSDLARKLGYPETTVSNWINANTYPRIDKIEEMSQFFGIRKSDLTEEFIPSNIYEIGEPTPIPILGDIACGDPIWATQNYDGYFALDQSIQADFILKAKGDSMIEVGINEGDKCFIRKTDFIETDGKIYVVLLDDSATLKRVYRTDNGYILQP